jgi:flagellar biosynthetic protein FlhB
MMAEENGGERTEQATGRRREQARDRGQVARSVEVTSAFLLLVGVFVLVASSGHFSRVLGDNTAYLLSQAHVLTPANRFGLGEMIVENLRVLVVALAPLLVAVLLAGLAANLAQVGFKFSPKALAFQTSKLNPVTGSKRFFQPGTWFDLGKNLVKILVISLLAWATIGGLMGPLTSLSMLTVPAIVAVAKTSFLKLMAKLLAFTVLVAVIDWFWQRHRHEENLKMSRYEVRKEHKDIEGDPQIKARVRVLQFEIARKRMLADVPRADVVVTNPTHFAVAIRYENGSQAPVVLAKGKDNLAQMIKKIARDSRVPVIENKPLARSLHKQVEVGHGIPESLFQAVAEVLAYVYRLKKA